MRPPQSFSLPNNKAARPKAFLTPVWYTLLFLALVVLMDGVHNQRVWTSVGLRATSTKTPVPEESSASKLADNVASNAAGSAAIHGGSASEIAAEEAPVPDDEEPTSTNSRTTTNSVLSMPRRRATETPAAQQLMLDLIECTNIQLLEDGTMLRQVVVELSYKLGFTTADPDTTDNKDTDTYWPIQVTELEPRGVGVMANWGDSHIALHTWPTRKVIMVNLFMVDEGNDLNLRLQVLPWLANRLEGNLEASTYSIIPRGPDVDVRANPAYSPAEIMTRHQYKHLVSEVVSPFQRVAVWDHHDTLGESTNKWTTRSLFLDGVMQSNIRDERQYHETLVQPAFIASARPPERILIVGGGEGGTLRETLKWKSVKTSVMVDLDTQVVDSSRRHLSTYSNCTNFGTTASCFDDPRTQLYTEDFFGWFREHIGDDICDNRQKAKEKGILFDVIILDLLDTEELPEGVAWATYLYSDLFFQRLACATADGGVLVSNFGEAPETPYAIDGLWEKYNKNPAVTLEIEREKAQEQAQPTQPQVLSPGKGEMGVPDDDDDDEDDDIFDVNDKPEKGTQEYMYGRKIQQLQSFSKQFRDFRVYDTFVPAFRASWAFAIGIVPNVSEKTEKKSKDLATSNLFEGTPVQVNYKLNQGLLPGAELLHYDGRVQRAYQQPTADWVGAYCEVHWTTHKDVCLLDDRFLPQDREMWKVVRSDKSKSTVLAQADLPKDTILGAWDDIVESDKEDRIARAMGTSCDPNTAPLVDFYSSLADLSVWNPVLSNYRSEAFSSVILLRNVTAGEQLTRKRKNC